ncbi:ribbon-helix-helix protein, CopG family [Thermoactinomyces vulgaris]|uniref:ribbon-helix-helix protein, CopG family n=1 Tax=Thermoactinomyces vulgaris TaxID=2026 RepID=UPI003636904C
MVKVQLYLPPAMKEELEKLAEIEHYPDLSEFLRVLARKRLLEVEQNEQRNGNPGAN